MSPSKKTPELKKQYLITGPCTGENPVELKDGTLELVTDKVFGMESIEKKLTLIAADNKGVLRSVEKDGSYKPQSKTHFHKLPIKLSVIPGGAARYTFIAEGETWQKKLLEQLNSIDGKFIETIPVQFSKQHLKKPEEFALEGEKKAYKEITGGNCLGQLIRKIRGVFLLFPKEYFSKEEIVVKIFDRSGKKLDSIIPKDATPIEYISSLDNVRETNEYRVVMVSDINYELDEGRYRVTVSKNFFDDKYLNWFITNKKEQMTFTVDVKFSVHSLAGDFDFHQLTLQSLEDVVVTQYPHRYTHITSMFMKEPSGKAGDTYSAYKSGLKTWIERTEWFNTKQKLITGLINGDADSRVKTLGGLLLKELGVVNQDNEQVKKEIDSASKVWDASWAVYELKDSWDSYFDQLKVSESVKKIQQTVDGNWLQKTCHATRWKKYLLAHAGDDDKSELVLKLLDKGLNKDKAALLIKDGIPKEAFEFDSAMLKMKTAGKALAVLDQAVSIYQIVNLMKQQFELGDTFDTNNNRYISGCETYEKKYGEHINMVALNSLEALRRLTDATKMKLDDNAKKLLLQTIDFTLSLLVYVPVVGEVAALILAVKATVETAANFAGSIGTAIDQKFLDDYFTDLNTYFSRLAQLEKEFTINLGAIADLVDDGESNDSAALQFRLRAAVVTGLLRLLDRCGTRYNNAGEFSKKYEQYDINGYIDTFILKVNPEETVTIQSDIPLDEVWLFCRGNKEGMGLVAAHRGFRFLKKNSWALPAFVNPISGSVGIGVKAVQLVTAPKVSLSYQNMFPIHHLGTENAAEFARLFSIDYSGVNEANVLYSDVYVYDKKNWHSVSSFNGTITPLHQIRVAVIFTSKNKKEDLTGLPVSIQLVRTDPWPDIYGPVYKAAVGNLGETDRDGLDKGLLPVEQKFIVDNRCYGVVVHPFYFLDDALLKGTKPCGHIGISRKPEFTCKFVIKIGGKKFDLKCGTNGGKEYAVQVPLVQPYVEMLIRRDFLDNKTSDRVHSPVFVNMSHTIKPLGVFIRKSNKWFFRSADTEHLRHGADFDFRWDRPFEIIFVMTAMSYHAAADKKKKIKFPVQVTAMEEVFAFNNQGPSYPADAVGSRGPQLYQKDYKVSEIEAVLRQENVIYSDETVGNGNGTVQMKGSGFVFAVRIKFCYAVEDKNGEMKSYDRFKPFGGKFKTGNEEYEYKFILNAPQGIGMPKMEFNTGFHVPGIPGSFSDMPFITSEKFITGDATVKSLSIQTCDYQ